MKDEQGRPFIVVREYVKARLMLRAAISLGANQSRQRLMIIQPREEKEAAWHRRR